MNLLGTLLTDFQSGCGVDRKNWSFQDVKADILFHLSHVFNPVHLFHLFLAEASLLHCQIWRSP